MRLLIFLLGTWPVWIGYMVADGIGLMIGVLAVTIDGAVKALKG